MTRHAQIEWLCGLWSFAAPVWTWRVMPLLRVRVAGGCALCDGVQAGHVRGRVGTAGQGPLRDEAEAHRHDELGERMRVRLGIDAPSRLPFLDDDGDLVTHVLIGGVRRGPEGGFGLHMKPARTT
jgi:hypothetical protein